MKAPCIADSTMEAEYIATYETAKETVWLRKFLMDLQVIPAVSQSLTLYCDNSGAVANSKEPKSHKRAKHIEMKYYLIRDTVDQGKVIMCKIVLENNLADLLTKVLPVKSFEGHLIGLGM